MVTTRKREYATAPDHSDAEKARKTTARSLATAARKSVGGKQPKLTIARSTTAKTRRMKKRSSRERRLGSLAQKNGGGVSSKKQRAGDHASIETSPDPELDNIEDESPATHEERSHRDTSNSCDQLGSNDSPSPYQKDEPQQVDHRFEDAHYERGLTSYC